MNDLTSCRNGVFAIISAVKGFKGKMLEELLQALISSADKLCMIFMHQL